MKELLRLHPYRASGTLEWRSPESVVPKEWVDFILSPIQSDGSRLLVLSFSRDPCDPKERLILEQVRAGFDQRWLARCPSCDHTVRKLYLVEPPEESTRAGRVVDLRTVACKKCARLEYRSVQTHDQRVDRARKDPAGFLASRARLTSTRSQLITASILMKAERREFRVGAG